MQLLTHWVLAQLPFITLILSMSRNYLAIWQLGNRKSKQIYFLFPLFIGFTGFMGYFVYYGTQSMYKLYTRTGLTEIGIITGVITLPLGYHIMQLIANHSYRLKTATAREKQFTHAFFGLLVYPLGAFLLFFIVFIIELKIRQLLGFVPKGDLLPE